MSFGACGPQTIAWWREHDDRTLASLVVAGPGPPPTFDGAWLRVFGQPAASPRDWSVVTQVPLGPLPETMARFLRETPPAVDGTNGSLWLASIDRKGQVSAGASSTSVPYDACVRAATELIANRLSEPIVAEQPLVSGVVLTRAGTIAEHFALELTPATVGDRGITTSLLIQSVRFAVGRPGQRPVWGPELELDTADLIEARYADVDLPGAPGVRLPAALVGWTPPHAGGYGTPSPSRLFARIAIALSELRLPESLQGGWRIRPGGWPAIDLLLPATDLSS